VTAPGRDDTTDAGRPYESLAAYPHGTARLDHEGRVWTVTRDGGMVVRPTERPPTNVESAGLHWLAETHGPLTVLYDAPTPPPAATPGRDELREQVAAALDAAGFPSPVGASAIVLPVVDAWVAAHTAEVAELREYVRSLHEMETALRAAVARVRALCDEWDGQTVVGLIRQVAVDELRAVLDPPTEQT
jgi:hypothetical protein